MTLLHYYIADPTKNITALVETPLPAASRPFAARQIMRQEPACEQVGFVYRGAAGESCLAMAGGEFCGNASMSAAALRCAKDGIQPGETCRVVLHVSGAAGPVPVQVTARAEGGFACTVRMPPPEGIRTVRLPVEGRALSLPVVYFPGIAHIIVAKDELDAASSERTVRDWCGRLSAAGLGIMLFDREALSLRPLVYVPAADTLFWESSCASGTAALGAWLANDAGRDVELCVKEPGGTLRVRSTPVGKIELTGQVIMRSEGKIVVDVD